MSLTLAAILAGIGAAASAGGSIAAMGRNREEEDSLLGEKSDLQTRKNLGLLEVPGYRAAMAEMDRTNRKNLLGIDNSAVSSGATAENKLAQKNAANEVMANAVGRAIQKEDENQKYFFSANNSLNRRLGELRAQQAQNWMNIANNVAQSAGTLGASYLEDGVGGGGSSTPEQGSERLQYLGNKALAAQDAATNKAYLDSGRAAIDKAAQEANEQAKASVMKSIKNIKPVTGDMRPIDDKVSTGKDAAAGGDAAAKAILGGTAALAGGAAVSAALSNKDGKSEEGEDGKEASSATPAAAAQEQVAPAAPIAPSTTPTNQPTQQDIERAWLRMRLNQEEV